MIAGARGGPGIEDPLARGGPKRPRGDAEGVGEVVGRRLGVALGGVGREGVFSGRSTAIWAHSWAWRQGRGRGAELDARARGGIRAR